MSASLESEVMFLNVKFNIYTVGQGETLLRDTYPCQSTHVEKIVGTPQLMKEKLTMVTEIT